MLVSKKATQAGEVGGGESNPWENHLWGAGRESQTFQGKPERLTPS